MKKRLLLFFTAILLLFSFTACNIIVDIGSYSDYYDDLSQEDKITSSALASDDVLRVRFINVGQGDSTLIKFPNGKSMLIDTGEYYSEEAVASAIEEEGLTHIDILVATHPHSDHIGSMAAIISRFEFSDIYMPNATSNSKSFEGLLDAIDKYGLNAIEAKAGMSIDIDNNVKIEILAPVSEEYDNTNNYSIVLRMTYRNTSFLFMGDAEKLVEEKILNSGADIRADILKLGHHGSSTSSKKEFISAVNPSIAIASCGKDNSYGHPHDETVKLLKDKGITMLVTYETGDIIVETDGNSIVFDNNIVTASKDSTFTEPIANSDTHVYVSKSGKYHNKDCQHYSSSFTKMTKEEAQAAGHTACKSCNP